MVTMRNFVLFLLVLIKSSNAELFNRQKRFLIFPRSAPTRHQFIAGIGIPVDLESQSVTIGYVFKTQYYLPYNASQLRLSETFPLDRDKKSLQQNKPPKLYENWHQKPKATDVDKSRWNFYKGIEAVANARGIEGRPCLLRTICEVAEVPFGELNGILGQLMHIMFTPSSSNDPILFHTDNQYIGAEQVGRSGASCRQVFSECSFSLLDVVSKIVDMNEN